MAHVNYDSNTWFVAPLRNNTSCAAGPDGVMPYSGVIDCASKILRAEGPLAFWVSWRAGRETLPITAIFLSALFRLDSGRIMAALPLML